MDATMNHQGSPSASANKNNVTVVARFRPSPSKSSRSFLKVDSSSIAISDPSECSTTHQFEFDSVFGQESSQEDVFNAIGKPVVQATLEGYNSTIFAYGQTGSGKTYTMEGSASASGLVPRVVNALFAGIQSSPDHVQYGVSVSMIEVYNEKVNDLLDRDNTNLQIHEDIEKGIWVENARTETLTQAQDILEILKIGQKNRATASTKLNRASSRSHSLFMLKVSQRDLENLSSKISKLILVDLAGSERVHKSGITVGKRLSETKSINKSLSTLGLVINTLTDPSSGQHIPYRDSKLTRVLQESLGGNSITAMVVCCSTAACNYSETISTLRFASRAKLIENKAKINQEFSAAKLKLLLAKAKEEIVVLKSNSLIKILQTELKNQREQNEQLVAQMKQESLDAASLIEKYVLCLSELEQENDMLREQEETAVAALNGMGTTFALEQQKNLELSSRIEELESSENTAALVSRVGKLETELKETKLQVKETNKRLAEAREAAQSRERELQRRQMKELTDLRQQMNNKIKEMQLEEEQTRRLLERQLVSANQNQNDDVEAVLGLHRMDKTSEIQQKNERLQRDNDKLKKLLKFQEEKLVRRGKRLKMLEKKFLSEEITVESDDRDIVDEENLYFEEKETPESSNLLKRVEKLLRI